jgi:hypothetical protein
VDRLQVPALLARADEMIEAACDFRDWHFSGMGAAGK